MTNAFVPTCNFTSLAEKMFYLKMFTFFGDMNVITGHGHSLWLFCARSSCIHAPHTDGPLMLELSQLSTHPTSRLLPPVPAAHPAVLLCLVPWPRHLPRLVNDAAKIVSPPLFNDMISLLSFIGKTKTGEGRSLSSQPWH